MRTQPRRRPVRRDTTVAGALFGASRRAILALLYGRPDEAFYLREIARTAGLTPSSLQRDLATLTDAGIVERTRRGHQVYFRANRECPVFDELRGLVVKTFGVLDVLRDALAPLEPRVAIAFVYGSVARGEDRPGSDVDVLVVGDVKFGEVVEALAASELRLGREVNPTVYPRHEFARKLRERDHFLATVVADKKLFLVGGENELRDLARSAADQAASVRKAGNRKPPRGRRSLPR